ncbi:MAG: hypothetical protein K6A68_01065 [Clostridiales bacterium]|nr:hypothetical protein [Clostridiales bacterium]
MIIVSKDGSGDYTSIQDAIDSVKDADRNPTIILVRMNEYRERVIVNKDNIRIVGEARDRTVITWSACAKDQDPEGRERGTFLSFTMLVTGHNVGVENLTIRNDAGDGRKVGQAMAVYAAGDRGVWRNCRLMAAQDTLFCGPVMPKVEKEILPRISHAECVESVGDSGITHGRQYFEDCWIQGDVDFIFGPYRCWFERCTLFMNERGGWYTAANTPEGQPHGLVFHRCTLTGACQVGGGYLGRPWRKHARTVFLECSMDEHVSPLGFTDWDAERVVTENCGEWHTGGAQRDQKTRHPGQKRMNDDEASVWNVQEVLGGYDGWRPDRRIPTWYLCGDSTMANYPETAFPMTGWGQMLQSLLSENIFVENCAICGRSSKSFLAEKWLSYIEICLREGDKLIISFSHNDEKKDPLRYTSPFGTFPDYLSLYIDAARAHGAEPVLVTPIARRHFDASGRLLATHGDYPESMRKLAVNRGVRLVDLEKGTMEILQNMSDEESRKLYCHVPKGHPNYPDGAADNSHLHRRGAIRYAALFLSLFRGEKTVGEIEFSREQKDLTGMIAKEDSVLG